MLKARILTALALLAAFLCVLFLLPKPAAAVAFAAVAGLAAWEWAGLMAVDKGPRLLFVFFVLVSCHTTFDHPEFGPAILLPLSALFWLAIVPLWLRRGWRLAGNDAVGYAVGWILVVPTWAAMVALHDRQPWLLFAAMALVWVADIAAFFTGRALGRHRLAPMISPGKTWEGVGGAVVGVLVYGTAAALAAGIPLGANAPWAVVLVLLTAVSILGDLFESLIKRQAGVKDSGSLLPGHGGILDRIDSQTSTLPLAALVLHWIRP